MLVPRRVAAVGVVLASAFSSAAQDLFAIDYDSAILYRVNPVTAALTPIGTTGVTGLGSLERARDGMLYAVTTGSTPVLYAIHPATAAATMIGPLGSGFVFEGGLAIAPNGTGYTVNGNNSSAARLLRVDLATGASATIGSFGAHDINGLAWRRDGVLVGLDRVTSSLLTIDPVTLVTNTLAPAPAALGAAGGMTATGDQGFFNTGGPGGSIPGSNSLYSFSLFTGASTLVGSFAPTITGTGIAGLAGCGGCFGNYGVGLQGSAG